MLNWLIELDRILRGDATRIEELRTGDINIPTLGISAVVGALAVVYAVCMGFYAIFRPDGPLFMQFFVTLIKVPALYFLTLAVTLPSLYVSSTMVGSRLNLFTILRLAIAALGVNLAVLASLGPIVAFFSVSTESYSFMILLNVVVFAVSGWLGCIFLLRTLNRLCAAKENELFARRILEKPSSVAPPQLPAEASQVNPAPNDSEILRAELAVEQGPLNEYENETYGDHVRSVFACWIIVFGLVGAQMSWVLRPFIGAPGSPFALFRGRGSSFFEAVLKVIGSFLS